MAVINETTTFELHDDVAVITIDSPPVNALSVEVRAGIIAGIQRATADDRVSAIVLACGGRTFFAGADIGEFDGPPREPTLFSIMDLLDGCKKPVVAALHGTALGGGLEIALACHYRVAAESTKVGLPEVTLGILPGAGGTQRLPRLVGVAQALEMIAFGKLVDAGRALAIGLVDGLVSGTDLTSAAVTFARTKAGADAPRRVRDLEHKLAEARDNPAIFTDFRTRHAAAFKGYPAMEGIVQALEAATRLPFDEGIARERAIFYELVATSASAAQRYLFFAHRAVGKIADIPADTPIARIKSVGVVGAGTMGTGIAMNFLNIGTPVTLVEREQSRLDQGVAKIRKDYERTAAKGRLTNDMVEQRIMLLKPELALDAVSECDLVIEAVFENMEIKKAVFSQLDKAAKPGALLASNTSFLNLDEIAAATARPEAVVGLHFFSPANVMPLLEVVRGARTSRETIATAMDVGRRIRKTCVLAGVCDGFIANRAMYPRSVQAGHIILEGPLPWEVDKVMTDFGFPMGTFAMGDLVGLDVIGWDAATSSGSSVQELLCERGRWGQKTGGGYYDYDDQRRALPSPLTEQIIREFAARKGIPQRTVTPEEIVERMLYPVINEGAKIIEEGIAQRASDIDVALTLGYGWPRHTGGPMFWAGQIGLRRIVERLDELAQQYGAAFEPAPLLRRMAAEDRPLHVV